MTIVFSLKSACTNFLMIVLFTLTACNQSESPTDISQQFWNAVQDRDMETAKVMATWDTVDYLKYLNADKLHPERFELREQIISEARAEVETVLFTSKSGSSGIKLPGVTVLIKTDAGWRVDIKKSMASVVKYSANNVFDQLNGLMQEGIKELDQSFSGVMSELAKALDEGTEELQRELKKPLFAPNKN